MAVRTEGPAPYAPPASVISLIDRYRDRGLQTPITLDVLSRAGVTESLAPRTLQALKLLDLIEEDGQPTQNFETLRLAPATEYQQRFREFLESAYQDVFAYTDPEKDSDTAIRDAFRGYEPRGQQARMVTLFLGLCEHAGMQRPEQKTTKAPRTAPPRRTTRKETGTGRRNGKKESARSYPPLLAGLLESLPKDGGSWRQEDRDRFLAALPVVLDFCFPVEQDEAE